MLRDVRADKDVNSFESPGMWPKTGERSPNTVQTNEVQNSEKEMRKTLNLRHFTEMSTIFRY